MRKIVLSLIAAAAVASPAVSAKERLNPEAQLARALEGRVAGKPVNCINMLTVRSSRIIEDTAILYEAGGTVYVNRPRGGRESLDRWDVLVTRMPTSQLCSVDVVHLYDPVARIETGFVSLGEFVPYRRTAR